MSFKSFRGISGFALWIVLGLTLAAIPLACSGSSSNNDSSSDSKDMTNPN